MAPSHEQSISNQQSGVWYGIVAYASWGILPLYWKSLHNVPAIEILAHRIFWSFGFIMILIGFFRRWDEVRQVAGDVKKRGLFLGAALLISANWFIYIWAVNAGHIVECSLGYYINPLFSICLGMLFLKEKLNFWQLLALGFALTGVFVLTVQYGKIPWIALTLTVTFGLYGLVKKLIRVEAMIGLTLETLIVAPVALGYILWLQVAGNGALGNIGPVGTMMLIGAGIVTALPLLWFAQAANRIPLSTLGFIQYLSPTISLLLGVFIYREPFTRAHLVSFGLIWAALVIFSCSNLPCLLKIQPKKLREISLR
jgi:chloramphenicol-sensitive protein RarD